MHTCDHHHARTRTPFPLMPMARRIHAHHHARTHVCRGMDCYARGLLAAAKMLEEGTLPGMVKARYSSFDSGFGKVKKGEGRRHLPGWRLSVIF